MRKFVFFLVVLFGLALPSLAQELRECRENRTYKGSFFENCETRQVAVMCKADSIVDFYQNAYVSDTVVNGRICKVQHAAIIRKRVVMVPVYQYIQVCRVEAVGDVIREVYVDCKE